jgi:hypothetical protein
MRGPWRGVALSTCERADAEFVQFAPSLPDFARTLLLALQRAPLIGFDCLGAMPCVRDDEGMWLEFGVYRGNTITRISQFRNRTRRVRGPTYGFDSFHGLPHDWRPASVGCSASHCRRGAFSLRGSPPFVADGRVLEWVVGWFNETLPRFLAAHPSQHVSFLHIDSDLYSSASTIFTELGPRRLRPGAIVVFNELFNYRLYLQNEIRALWEFLRAAPHLALEIVGSSTHNIMLDPDREGREQHPQSAAFRLVRTRRAAAGSKAAGKGVKSSWHQ